MKPNLPPMNREDLEAKVTALLLGELPEGEAVLLRELIARDAGLTRLHGQLSLALDLLRQTAATPESAPSAPMKLSEARREKLLAHFKTVAPKEFAPAPRRRISWLVPLAAVAAVVLLAGVYFPNITGRTKVKTKGVASVPTMKDFLPFLGHMEREKAPSSEGQTYYLGTAGQPPVARFKNNLGKETTITLPGQDGNLPALSPAAPGMAEKEMAGLDRSLSRSDSARVAGGKFSFAPASPIVLPATPQPPPAAEAVSEPTVGGLIASAQSAGEPASTPALNVPGTIAPGPAEQAAGEAASASALRGGTPSQQLSEIGHGTASASAPLAGDPYARYRMQMQMMRRMTPPPGGVGGEPSMPNAKPSDSEAPLRQMDELARNKQTNAEFVGYDSPGQFVPTAQSVSGSTIGVPLAATMPVPHFRALPPEGNRAPDSNGNALAFNNAPSQSSLSVGYADPSQVQTVMQDLFKGTTARPNSSSTTTSALQQRETQNESKLTASITADQEGRRLSVNPADGATATTGVRLRFPAAESFGGGAGGAGGEVEKKASVASGNSSGRSTSQRNLGEMEKKASVASGEQALDEKLNDKSDAGLAQAALPPTTTTALGRATLPAQTPQFGDAPLVGAAFAQPALPPPTPQPEVETRTNSFSTFSLNVSDASFKLAAASLQNNVLPQAASIRSEEFINAFDYRDPDPAPGAPIGFAWERAQFPFAHNRDLLRFSVKTAAQGRQAGRPLNLVLLLDKSGSMERADRVAIIHEALRVLASQLQAQDTLSVVVFARTARLWVDGVPGSQAGDVANGLNGLTPEGGTNLEDAMKLAYETALRHYLADGENRVVLLTDGAANLGNIDPETLKQKVEANRKQGIALDCFGVGWDGYNDNLMETLSRAGNGRYGFINTPEEAATDLAAKLAGALRVAASDVKVQVEFNPNRVTAYRQIGYAHHQLAKEQFRDNSVAAAQIGAAESGNALYTVEINPAGDGPLCTVRVRFRVPGTADYQEHAWDVPYTGTAVTLDKASAATRLAATAAAFAEWLASSPYAAEVTPDQLLAYLRGVPEVYGADARPKNLEWIVRQAKSITGK